MAEPFCQVFQVSKPLESGPNSSPKPFVETLRLETTGIAVLSVFDTYIQQNIDLLLEMLLTISPSFRLGDEDTINRVVTLTIMIGLVKGMTEKTWFSIFSLCLLADVE